MSDSAVASGAPIAAAPALPTAPQDIQARQRRARQRPAKRRAAHRAHAAVRQRKMAVRPRRRGHKEPRRRRAHRHDLLLCPAGDDALLTLLLLPVLSLPPVSISCCPNVAPIMLPAEGAQVDGPNANCMLPKSLVPNGEDVLGEAWNGELLKAAEEEVMLPKEEEAVILPKEEEAVILPKEKKEVAPPKVEEEVVLPKEEVVVLPK